MPSQLNNPHNLSEIDNSDGGGLIPRKTYTEGFDVKFDKFDALIIIEIEELVFLLPTQPNLI